MPAVVQNAPSFLEAVSKHFTFTDPFYQSPYITVILHSLSIITAEKQWEVNYLNN